MTTTITPIIKALEGCWRSIKGHHEDLPEAIILTGPGKRTNVLGHFGPNRWRTDEIATTGVHEVMVMAEHLNRGAEDIIGTMIHEAAHALNEARGIRDVSSSQYHNKRFKAAAEELGLDVARYKGWSSTSMTALTRERYATEIEALGEVLQHYRVSFKGVKKSKGRMLKAICSCGHPIRMSRKVFEATAIRCETCSDLFQLVE